MKSNTGTTVLLALLAVLALYIWRSAAGMPAVVASHFAASGAANGFMLRGVYTGLMLVLGVGVPLLLAWLPASLAGKADNRLNIPNRAYWLAPERRGDTLAFIRCHGQWFAAALALFLAFVHGLVVRANAHRPPVLSGTAMLCALVVFFCFVAVWVAVLIMRFRRA